MMYENNNKAIVSKLAKRSIKANKMRNTFAILAIILTTVLFTTVFTIGLSMLKSIEYSTMRQVGISSHGGFKYLTTEEYEILKSHKDIKEYGITIPVTFAENPELAKRQVEVNYVDENAAKYRFILPLLKGDMPKEENEILLDTITLDMLGLNYELDQTVTLDYNINGIDYTKDFILSGYYEGDIVSMASSACVSEKFIEENLSGIDQKLSKETGSYTGVINLNVMLNNKYNIEEKLNKILHDSGFEQENIPLGINWAYMGSGSTAEMSNFIPLAGLLLLIMISGYLIIYNLFYISVVKDTRFYGLLKTIGATAKQLKIFIRKQAVMLSIIGIPSGLILGYLLGIVLLKYVMQLLTISHTAISVNPIIFIGSALFSMMTVLISCNKPAQLASRTSPVEAVRYTGVVIGKKKIKKTSNGAKLYKMAFSNIFRNKKKAFIVIISLSISMVLLNCVYTVVTGFDMDKYLSGKVGSDFSIGDVSFYRWQFDESNSNAITEELCNDIENIPEVKGVHKLYNKQISIPLDDKAEDLIKNSLNEEYEYKRIYEDIITGRSILVDIYGIDNRVSSLLSKYLVDGELDSELFKSGDYAIVVRKSWDMQIYNVGDKITLSTEDGAKEYTILGIVESLPSYIYSGKMIVGAVNLYIPSEEYLRYTDKHSIMTAIFDVEEGYVSSVEEFIKNKVKEIPTLDYRSKAVYEKEYNEMIATFNIVGYTLSFIIGLIGVLNFTNVIITSIISRRQEFATIQSIGMTSKQLRKLLIFEGLYYALIIFVVILAIGLPITYFGVKSFAGQMSFFSYHFTMFPVIICIPVMIIIAVMIPVLGFADIKNTSIVERLRETE